ncbi:hypothetical protein [Georgenia faecalis]|uniref:Uncharacterized protein n=1 Tax=Georgenia faecalis TaxID=2483799 RepID=A0ABV9D7I3_9MICO|nr:hypothetical protein [Georgenia faecalis]
MTETRRPSPISPQWAPWWIYLVVLLGANYLREGLFPTGHLPVPVAVVIALGQAAVLFTLVTAIWRWTRPRTRERG